MKTIIGAVALIVAAPVAAQTTPAADPHAAHKQHAPADHTKAMDGCKMPCCEKMKQGAPGEKKGCCAEGGKTPAGQKSKQHHDH